MPKSGKSSKGTAVSAKSQTLPPVLPPYQGSDPSSLIFSEWVDQELNAEKWEHPKSKAAKSAKPPTPTSGKSEQLLYYNDPHNYHLPPSIKCQDWKRPQEVFPGAVIVMHKEPTGYSDFLDGSRHLLHSEFMRAFISSVGILEYMGYSGQWPQEAVGPNYTPNTANEPWKPWHHVYSMCKAGKGQTHRPQVNTLGKYIVRLYWMGCWRSIRIDDQLPVDPLNHVLLPTVEKNPEKELKTVTDLTETEVKTPKEEAAGEKKSDKAGKKKKGKSVSSKKSEGSKKNEEQIREIELWPFLLCKALMKLANFTFGITEELVDFDIIHALTGWIVQKISTHNLSSMDIWGMCVAYTDHYQWPEDKNKAAKEGATKDGKKGKKDKGSSKSSKKGKDSKKSSKKGGKKGEDTEKPLAFCLVASITDLRDIQENEVLDVSPCWSHTFLIHQTRNIPLLKPEYKPELARWKRFRWLAWAIENGIYIEDNYDKIKSLRMVSTFRKFSEHVVYPVPSQFSMDIKKSVAAIDKMKEEGNKGKKDKNEKGSGKSEKASKSPKKSKGSKSSKKSKKSGKSEKSVVPPPDPSIWVNFDTLYKYIDFLYVFLKPSQFPTNIKITDVKERVGKATKPEKKQKGGEERTQQKIIWPNTLLQSRNEPLYMFMDSMDYKYIIFNLNQAGNSDIITSDEDLTLCLNLDDVTIPTHRPISHIVVEKWNWQSNKIGGMSVSLNSYGTKSILVLIKPGRHTLRLWIKSTSAYVLYILSDTTLSVGTSEMVLEAMQAESQFLTQTCYDVGSNFGRLVQAFGMPEYREELRKFYSSYKPDTTLRKRDSTLIHEEFFEQLRLLIKEKYPDTYGQVKFALKVLFLLPDFGLDYGATRRVTSLGSEEVEPEGIVFIDPYNQKYSGPTSAILAEISRNENELEQEKIREQAAVVLQSFFKMIYVRKLQKYHSTEHKRYMTIFDTLKKIYKELLSVDNRVLYLSPIIRNMLLTNEKLCKLRSLYNVYYDLQTVINFQHYSGSASTSPEAWTPLAKYEFFVNSPEVIKICLYSNAIKYILRVFNNDTSEEVRRFTNNTCVSDYQINDSGYTVLAYGWCEDDVINWKLCFVSLKKSSTSVITIPDRNIECATLTDTYKPNVNDRICKCLININQRSNVTFRLSCSLNSVKIKLRCVDGSGNVCSEIVGTENVILPITIFKVAEKSLDRQNESTPSVQKNRSSIVKKKKRSSDTVSTRGSTTSLKRSKRSSQDTKDADVENRFLVEGYVLDDSWPLTVEEWANAEEVRKRNLLGPLMYPSSTTVFSGSRISMKKSPEVSRRTIDKRSPSTQLYPKPSWCLQMIYDRGDAVNVAIDKRRDEEIKSIKRGWYEDDPERYEFSKNIRNAYLEAHYLPEETTSFEERSEAPVSLYSAYSSKSDQRSAKFVSSLEERSLVRPAPPCKRLPRFSYANFICRMSMNENEAIFSRMSDISSVNVMEDGILKKPEDVQEDELRVQEAMQKFSDRRDQYVEHLDYLTEKHIKQNIVMENWFKECRQETEEMMNDAYDLRQKFIEAVIEAEKARRLQEKGSPEKEKKKGKKDKSSAGKKKK